MSALRDQRCLNHREREAVARCPSCREFYCRECVTEHLGRVICAKCLAGMAGREGDGRVTRSFIRPLAAAFSLLVVWSFFFFLGRALLMLPDSFHDGTVWSTTDSSRYSEDEQ